MMGVHGNGLTALLWMRPTPRSTVIEFFYPSGFAFDYQYTAHALGIQHYGVWNDVYVSLLIFALPSRLRSVSSKRLARPLIFI